MKTDELRKQDFTLLPFNSNLADKQIADPHCAAVLASGRQARKREDLVELREDIRQAGIEQGVWPLTVALDMKLSGNEAHAARVALEVRKVIEELFQIWRDIPKR